MTVWEERNWRHGAWRSLPIVFAVKEKEDMGETFSQSVFLKKKKNENSMLVCY